jgi:hypothetical protein
MTKTYYVDTNFFEECRVPRELPWAELCGPVAHIHLVVPSTVISEIDRHKKGNGRTTQRARDASALFKKALEAGGDHTIEINPSNPRITLALPPVLRVNYDEFPQLDRMRPDHQIVAESATLSRTIPGSTVLSNDTNLVLAARAIGLVPALIPEGWKRPRENDERDAEIIKLKDELRKYQNARPAVTLTVAPVGGNVGEALSVRTATYNMTSSQFDDVIDSIRRVHPLSEDFERSPPAFGSIKGTWQPPSDEAIAKYRQQEYPEWLSFVRKKVRALPSLLSAWSREAEFSVTIANTGHANADHARLTVTAFDELLLSHAIDDDDRARREEQTKLPAPPNEPTGQYVTLLDMAMGRLSGLHAFPIDSSAAKLKLPFRPAPHDPHWFYWVDGRPAEPMAQIERSCDALPHQVEPHKLRFRVVVPAGHSDFLGRVRVRIHASNLLQPVEQFLKVSVTTNVLDFVAVAKSLLLKN